MLLFDKSLVLIVYMDSIFKPIGKKRVAHEYLPYFQCGILNGWSSLYSYFLMIFTWNSEI